MLRSGCVLLAVGAVSVLVAFHAWLLLARLTSGAFDPVAALRWSGAAVVLLSLAGLRRLGIPLIGSRHAAVVWLLAALLHVGASAPVRLTSSPLDVAPAGLLVAAPAVSASVLAFAALASLARARRRLFGETRLPASALWRVGATGPVLVFEGFASTLAPRPPPR